MTDPRSDTHSDTGTLYAANLGGTPGATLREAREKAGWTVQEAAMRTKIPLPVIQAIEHDDTAHLGQPVYVRGYLRRYAKALNVPESSVMAAFDDRVAARQPPPQPAAPPDEPVEEKSGGNPLLWLLVIVIVAAIAGATVLYLRGGSLSSLMRQRPAAPRPAAVQRAPVVAPQVAPAPVREAETPPPAAPEEGTSPPPAAETGAPPAP